MSAVRLRVFPTNDGGRQRARRYPSLPPHLITAVPYRPACQRPSFSFCFNGRIIRIFVEPDRMVEHRPLPRRFRSKSPRNNHRRVRYLTRPSTVNCLYVIPSPPPHTHTYTPKRREHRASFNSSTNRVPPPAFRSKITTVRRIS